MPVSRRHFFYGSLLAGAVPAGGFGSAASLKQLGYKSPNEKLNIAAIGAGRQGLQRHHGLRDGENIVALADPDDKRAERTFKQFPNLPKYKDFRRMFDKEEQEHRRRAGLLPRPHARHRGHVGDGARQARLLPEAADPHGVGSAAVARWRRRSTRSPRRWATRATRTKARASAARSSGPARSATSPRSTPGPTAP